MKNIRKLVDEVFKAARGMILEGFGYAVSENNTACRNKILRIVDEI